MPHAPGSPHTPLVGIFDEMPLRRAEIIAFLSAWADANGLQLAPQGLTPPDHVAVYGNYRMAILPLGAGGFEASPLRAFVREMTVAAPACPVVVLSDRFHKADVLAAFRAGAMGYVPSTLEPRLALDALTLVLRGGHYFPPNAL